MGESSFAEKPPQLEITSLESDNQAINYLTNSNQQETRASLTFLGFSHPEPVIKVAHQTCCMTPQDKVSQSLQVQFR